MKDNHDIVIMAKGKQIGDHILVIECLAVHEVIALAIQKVFGGLSFKLTQS